MNFFQPSMKLIEKQREGARVKKRYDRAQTPYQRIIASGYLTKRKRERIESLYRGLSSNGTEMYAKGVDRYLPEMRLRRIQE